MINLFIVGPAGSGKTTLTYSFGKWLEKEGYSVGYINLDPGVILLPFTPSFDVREIVNINEIMLNEKLGPNGALIRASEIIENNMSKIIKKINSINYDYLLIDTPGQMELFLFREMGPLLSSSLNGRKASIFIIDPSFMKRKNDFITLKLLGIVVELRLGVPSIEIINKCDLLEEIPSKVETGMLAGLAEEISVIVEKIEKKKRTILVSAKNSTGFLELYSAINELFCVCGDLT
jgi:GTPase SAR1 family protein